MPVLLPLSQTAREHLLKRAVLRKLILSHLTANGPSKTTLSQVLLNISCVKEARSRPYTEALVKKSHFWRRHELNFLGAGEAKGLTLPEEVSKFRVFEDLFMKSLTGLGLIAYLASNCCT